MGQIIQTLNEQQPCGNDLEEKEKQQLKASYAYFPTEVYELYEDGELYTFPKPYIPPISFLGRLVKPKHDETPMNVLGEIMLVTEFKAISQYSNSIECFSRVMLDSPCCVISSHVLFMESL